MGKFYKSDYHTFGEHRKKIRSTIETIEVTVLGKVYLTITHAQKCFESQGSNFQRIW